jgi:4-hydroxy-3-methylbut-2-enyl diphosphate reductase
MTVVTPKHSGFCPGVKTAAKRLLKLKASDGNEQDGNTQRPVCVLGDLIHNAHYIRYLSERGIRSIERIEEAPEGTLIAIRTHGLDRERERELRRRFEVIDLTCPKVKRLQQAIGRYADQGYLIVITGRRSHPEVEGLVGYARDARVIESETDLEAFLGEGNGSLREYLDNGYDKVFLVSQTTGRRTLYERVLEKLSVQCDLLVESLDSLCDIVGLRADEAGQLQSRVDVTFVVGDRSSSNATRLYQSLRDRSSDTYFVQDLQELKDLGLDLLSYNTAQVVSSSSTPAFVEAEITRYLERLEPDEISS